MSYPPSGMYQTTYTGSPATFVDIVSIPMPVTSVNTVPVTMPLRYTVNSSGSPGRTQMRSTAFGTESAQDYRAIVGKSVGTFGQPDIRSTRVVTANGASEFSVAQANQITELQSQIRRLTEKSDQLFVENRGFKKDSEALIICRGRLEEKEAELKKLWADHKFQETTIGNLRVELERAYQKNQQLSNQIAEMFNKNPGRFHMDGPTQKIMSAEEYDLELKVRDFQERLIVLEKERDRLFVENYEFKKLHGEEIGAIEPEDLLGARYHNGLQITNMDLAKTKRKVEALTVENELLRNELNILRGIDCFEENDVKSGLNRTDDPTIRRNRTVAKGQRGFGAQNRADEARTGTREEPLVGNRSQKRFLNSLWR